MNKRPEFTDSEQFIVSYYRSKKVSPINIIGNYASFLLPAIFFAIAGFYKDDKAYLLVAYALLIYCIFAAIYRGCKYAGAIKSVIHKYDAKIDELSPK